MMSSDLPGKALDLNIALMKLSKKLDESNLHSVSIYILKHGMRASDYLHRSRRLTSKYRCISNFKIAVLEVDKTMCLITHLYKRGIITKEDYEDARLKCLSVRMSTFVDIIRYYQVPDL